MRVQLTRRNRPSPDQDGAAAVEMALMLPLLVLLLYGIIEFGLIFGQDLAIGNGAREGARYAASTETIPCNDGSADDVISLITDSSATTLLPTDELDISVHVGEFADVAAARASATVCTDAVADSDAVCDGATDNAATPGPPNVYVFSQWERGLSIPFGPVNDAFTLNGIGVFPCEYS